MNLGRNITDTLNTDFPQAPHHQPLATCRWRNDTHTHTWAFRRGHGPLSECWVQGNGAIGSRGHC